MRAQHQSFRSVRLVLGPNFTFLPLLFNAKQFLVIQCNIAELHVAHFNYFLFRFVLGKSYLTLKDAHCPWIYCRH